MCFVECTCFGSVLLVEGWLLGTGWKVKGFARQILFSNCGKGMGQEGQSHPGLSGVFLVVVFYQGAVRTDI